MDAVGGFSTVLEHFFNQMAASPENSQLLVYDNQSSTASYILLELVTLARARGVVIVTLPATARIKCNRWMLNLGIVEDILR